MPAWWWLRGFVLFVPQRFKAASRSQGVGGNGFIRRSASHREGALTRDSELCSLRGSASPLHGSAAKPKQNKDSWV